MVDHVVLAAISLLRQSFSAKLLEHQGPEDRLQMDLLLGDLNYEASFSLPFEAKPPRVRADVNLEWPTWSQSAYRSWVLGETLDEQPELLIQLVVRIQRLAELPDLSAVLSALKSTGPALGGEEMDRSLPTVERMVDPEGEDDIAVEITYDGTCRLDEPTMANPNLLVDDFDRLAQFVSDCLIHLSDLGLRFLPPEEDLDRN